MTWANPGDYIDRFGQDIAKGKTGKELVDEEIASYRAAVEADGPIEGESELDILKAIQAECSEAARGFREAAATAYDRSMEHL